MLVCICNAIREAEVRKAARQGVACPASAYRLLGRRAKCGQCIPYAREIIAEESCRTEAAASGPPSTDAAGAAAAA